MNTSKFSLADLLTVLGAIVFGFICYLSFNFLSMGEIVPSILWAVMFALVLGGLAFAIKILKKTSRNFKTCILFEWGLLFLFLIVALVSIIPFSHYFVISEQKKVIQNKVLSNISQVGNMFNEYEKYAEIRLTNYEGVLKSRVVNKINLPKQYRQCGFDSGSEDNTQIDTKLFILKSKLFLSNYLEMKRVDSTWLAGAKKTIEVWKPTGIVSVLNETEINFSSWKNKLIQLSQFRTPCGEDSVKDFDYLPQPPIQDLKDQITKMLRPSTLSIIYALGLYLIMLLSYFITKRHTRYPGLKVIFSSGKTSANEL